MKFDTPYNGVLHTPVFLIKIFLFIEHFVTEITPTLQLVINQLITINEYCFIRIQ